jgi:ornithine carbamoyltransferase
MKRDLVSFSFWEEDEILEVFRLAELMKRGEALNLQPLAKRTVALIFEKASLRTRVSFEVGVSQLGGVSIFLQQETIGMATRESVHDIASVLSRYNDLIIARTTRHQTCVQLAESATIPVINAMTDLVHPCQVLADYFTLKELGKAGPSTRIAFVGHGNNIVNSWLELAEKHPIQFTFSCPPGYEPHAQVFEQAIAAGKSRVSAIPDPMEAVRGADVVYTDVWPSVPPDDEGTRAKVFRAYQVNETLLKEAKPGCLVMHRLPANRGEEITRDIIDGRRSIVLAQAENRLHVQKGVMVFLLGGSPARAA